MSTVFRFVRQCLSLLSAMVAQGPAAAREVFSQIHINRSLSGLAKRKDKRVHHKYHLHSRDSMHGRSYTCSHLMSTGET